MNDRSARRFAGPLAKTAAAALAAGVALVFTGAPASSASALTADVTHLTPRDAGTSQAPASTAADVPATSAAEGCYVVWSGALFGHKSTVSVSGGLCATVLGEARTYAQDGAIVAGPYKLDAGQATAIPGAVTGLSCQVSLGGAQPAPATTCGDAIASYEDALGAGVVPATIQVTTVG